MGREKEETVTVKKRKVEDPDKKQVIFKVSDNFLKTYADFIRVEEEVANERDSDNDLQIFLETRKSFEQIIKDVTLLKRNKPEGWEQKVKEKRALGSVLSIALKKLNRAEKMRTKGLRECLNKDKLEVDSLQLKLQNIECELVHLRKEVNKCLSVKSKNLGIELVPLEEFYLNAPKKISRPEITKTDDHQLQISRLEWELEQRKEQAQLREMLESKKDKVASEIKKKRQQLNNLAPLIRKIIDVAKPLEEALDLPMAMSSHKLELAAQLPLPLYFLFLQLNSYKEACDKKLSLSIEGEEDEVKTLDTDSEEITSSENDSDIEGQDEDVDRRRKKERGSVKSKLKQKRFLDRHPMSVVFTVKHKGVTLHLQFYYLVQLNIVTVVPKLDLTDSASISGNLLLSNETILTSLWPGDTGVESPNTSNYFLFKQHGFPGFEGRLNASDLGFAYKWTQRLGGLVFQLGSMQAPHKRDSKTKADMLESQACVPEVVKAIKARLSNRLQLAKIVRSLEKGELIRPPVMSSIRLSSRLTSWTSITWIEYSAHPATTTLVQAEIVSQHDLFYKATAKRSSATLSIFIALKPNYPDSLSVIALQMETESVSLNYLNSEEIRDLEREVNVNIENDEDYTKLNEKHMILMYQLFKLLLCFDILLECKSSEEFVSERKTLFRKVRGRTRAHPYKFVNSGEGVFVHR